MGLSARCVKREKVDVRLGRVRFNSAFNRAIVGGGSRPMANGRGGGVRRREKRFPFSRAAVTRRWFQTRERRERGRKEGGGIQLNSCGETRQEMNCLCLPMGPCYCRKIM